MRGSAAHSRDSNLTIQTVLKCTLRFASHHEYATLDVRSLGRRFAHTRELQELLVEASGVVVQSSKATHGHIHTIVLNNPVGKHVHTRARPSSRPELASLTDNPLLFLGPLDLGHHLLCYRYTAVIRRGFNTVEYTGGRNDHAARAGREDGLDLLRAFANELEEILRHVFDVFGVRPADQQVVELGAVVDGAGWHGREACRVLDWIHGCADVMEFDVDASFAYAFWGTEGFHAGDIGLGTG